MTAVVTMSVLDKWCRLSQAVVDGHRTEQCSRRCWQILALCTRSGTV